MMMPEESARAAALGKAAMPQDMPMEEAPAEAQGPVPMEEVMAAMETLRPQVADMEAFEQALALLAQALGPGQAAEEAPTEDMSEEM